MSKAKEAAQKAQEAMAKVKAAEEALATAQAEAAAAKEEAKLAGKKKPAIESIEPVVETLEGTGATKELVLDFLQKNSLDLRRTIRGLMDVRFEDDPPRIVLDVVSGQVVVPAKYSHKGVDILTVKNVKAEIKGPVSLSEDPEKEEFYHRSIDGAGAKALGIKEALGPHSIQAAKNKNFEAFLKRHKAVKVSK